jgi:xanthine dehydrogenase small subunit
LPVLDGELAPISDARATSAYRRLVARNLLRKFQLETAPGRAAPPAATRVLAAVEEG